MGMRAAVEGLQVGSRRPACCPYLQVGCRAFTIALLACLSHRACSQPSRYDRMKWPASPLGAPLGAEDTGRAGRKRRAGGLCLLDVKQAVVGCLHMGWLALVAGWLALAVGCPVSQHLGEASRWARAGPRTPHGGPIAAGMSPSALKLLCGACCAAPAWCYHHCSVLSPVWTPAAAETLANVHCTRHCFSRTRRLSTWPPTSQTAAAAEALAQTLGSRRA